MAALQLHATTFHLVLEKFKATLANDEKNEFQVTTLRDLHVAIEKIQKKQASKQKLQNMRRLDAFLEAMKEFDKVIQVFVNSADILAFVWGPMKFLLQAACTFAEAFDVLLNAYERIGEHIPLLSQYEDFFRNQPQMARVLTLMYEDILTFHWQAMKYFKQKMWKQLIHALWRTFDSEFSAILRNLREHRSLLESQASILEFREIIRSQEIAKSTLELTKQAENDRRREVVIQWLSAAHVENDQESYQKVRQENLGSGSWLLKVNKFHAWFDPDFSSNQLLWLNGIPGAGKTVLASLVIDEAGKLPGVCVAFFYFRYQDPDRTTFLAFARGLLAQLIHQDQALLTLVYEKASKSGQATLSTKALAKDLLETAIKNVPKLYVIIDGIDECEKDERQEIIAYIEGIWESLPIDDTDTFRCMSFSQDDNVARNHFTKWVSLKLTESDIRGDIRSYAKLWSQKTMIKFDLSEERRSFMENIITQRSEGMMLFAKLMCFHLHEQTTRAKLDDELIPSRIPHGPLRLDEVYARIIRRAFGEHGLGGKDDVKRLLTWLIFAKRPLKWTEIQCAVSIDVENATIDWSRNHFRVDSKELCGPLIEIHSDDTIILVHHTAKRYLAEKALVESLAIEELKFTVRCFTYLCLPSFDLELADSDISDYVVQGHYGLFDYAVAYWARHLERSVSVPQSDNDLRELAEAVSIFVDTHWIEPQVKAPVPKSTTTRLLPLKQEENFENIALAVHIARKQLNAVVKMPPEELDLTLYQFVTRLREVIEDLAVSTTEMQRLIPIYGNNLFKCPRLSCTRFYNGFPTKRLRDDHVPKHERSYFCSFLGCAMNIVGCATLKELQKHESDSHGSYDLEDEFPEIPVEKTSFDCSECGKAFTRKHNLNLHMRKHNASAQSKFACSHCGKSFARLNDRTRHESTFHSNPKDFTCGGFLKSGAPWGCGRNFNRSDVLKRHYNSERGRNCRLLLEEEEASETPTSLWVP